MAKVISVFSEMTVITVKAFNKAGSELDKNGNQNVYLEPISGRFPANRNVMAGTLAETEKLEVGKNYLVKINELEPSEEYGRQFTFSRIGEPISAIELLNSRKNLEKVQLVLVEEKLREDVKTPETNIE